MHPSTSPRTWAKTSRPNSPDTSSHLLPVFAQRRVRLATFLIADRSSNTTRSQQPSETGNGAPLRRARTPPLTIDGPIVFGPAALFVARHPFRGSSKNLRLQQARTIVLAGGRARSRTRCDVAAPARPCGKFAFLKAGVRASRTGLINRSSGQAEPNGIGADVACPRVATPARVRVPRIRVRSRNLPETHEVATMLRSNTGRAPARAAWLLQLVATRQASLGQASDSTNPLPCAFWRSRTPIWPDRGQSFRDRLYALPISDIRIDRENFPHRILRTGCCCKEPQVTASDAAGRRSLHD